jgi:hypothetical protein
MSPPKKFEARRIAFVEGKQIEMPPVVFHLKQKGRAKAAKRRKTSD